MAYTSGFFDAIDQGGGDYDRVYSAANFAHYFSLLVQNGVFPNPSTGMQVKASTSPDMHVSVQPGSGWINGYYITVPEDTPEVLTVPTANPSLSRIDSVIMGLNYVQREIQLYIKSGAVSASPSAVSLQRDNDLYELELAQITISAGMVSITQASITDMRSNTSRCGIVKGMIDQIDTTDLFAQYDAEFQEWFADIKTQLSGDVATNLQNQINTLKTDKVNVLDKASTAQAQAGTDNTKWMTPALVKAYLAYILATTAEAQAGSIDTKWMSPVKVKSFYNAMKATTAEAQAGIIDTKWVSPNGLLSSIKSTERGSYLSFCANVNSDALDAAFGKNNVDDMFAIGKQLAMYSWFKGDSKSSNPYTVTKTLDSLSDIYSNPSSIVEVEKTGVIPALIELSPFAKSVRDSALATESITCVVIATRAGLSNPETFTTVLSLTANSTFMNSQTSVAMAFTYPAFLSSFCNNNTNWVRMTNYTTCMLDFQSSEEVDNYLTQHSSNLLTEKTSAFTGNAVYVHRNNGLNKGNYSDNKATIAKDLDGKTYTTEGHGDKIGNQINRKFFKPCTFTVSGDGGKSLLVKVIS